MKTISKLVLRGITVSLRRGSYDHDAEAIEKAKKKIKKAHIPYAVNENSFFVFKRSVDARKKNEILFVYSVLCSLSREILLDGTKLDGFSRLCAANSISVIDEEKMSFSYGTEKTVKRPVVAGFGPCGMFCALLLSRAGFRPIVLERGENADVRAESVEKYWKTGVLDTETNVQFGEGGAGTFSDGKLMTRINDRYVSFVLQTFYENGADADILVNAKPHVGTDKLRDIVKNIRKKIIENGGEVRFGTKLTDIVTDSAGKLTAVKTQDGVIETDALFLAIGHSARDTFRTLFENGVKLLPKPFSVGVRVEHLQKDIDRALYGDLFEEPALPKGEYALSARFGERAVYSFCMCPGGKVVASASDNGEIVTNGMSYSSRDGINANAAIAVSVSENDCGNNVFSAIDYQKNIEHAAFVLAGSNGAAPIETMGHFLGKTKKNMPDKILPTYTGKTVPCDISEIFPAFVTENLKLGFSAFEKSIKGFSANEAILTAPETRTSSPVRIPRGENFISQNNAGIYPCGEGAGYAGGITSAAVDGIKCALSYINSHVPQDV